MAKKAFQIIIIHKKVRKDKQGMKEGRKEGRKEGEDKEGRIRKGG